MSVINKHIMAIQGIVGFTRSRDIIVHGFARRKCEGLIQGPLLLFCCIVSEYVFVEIPHGLQAQWYNKCMECHDRCKREVMHTGRHI